MATGWEIYQVGKLLVATFANDNAIKAIMSNVTGSGVRVSNSRIPRTPVFPYIYFYFIHSPDVRVQGGRRVMSKPDVDIEVRNIGAPTADSIGLIERVDELMGMSRTLTPDGKWVVSAIPKKPIDITEKGETTEVYYTRQGRTYSLQVVAA